MLDQHPMIVELETRCSQSDIVMMRRRYSYAVRLKRISNILLRDDSNRRMDTKQIIYYARVIHLMTLPLMKNSPRPREDRSVRFAHQVAFQVTRLLADEETGFDERVWHEWVERL